MAYESSKSSTKNQVSKVGTSAKSSAKLAATSGETKSGMPTMSGSEVTFQECDAIEEEIAALKVSYEHYFLGTERAPPTRQYEDLKKRVMRLKSSFVRNTSAKFRVQSIHGKFVTYERLWQRTMQEIENGTYKRDVVKARRRLEKKPTSDRPRSQTSVELPDEELEALDAPPSMSSRGVPSVAPLVPPVAPVTRASGIPSIPSVAPAVKPLVPSVAPAIPSVAPLVPPIAPAVKPLVPSVAPVAARPAAPPRAAAPAPRPASAASAGDLSDAKLKSVYDAYVAAKRNNKEDTSKMSYDNIAASLRKQVPELMKQHKANSVEFKVVIKDGKAVLKAVPK
jgi:hypothetical protein